MRISVCLCTWNRSRLLDQTLTKLRDVVVPPGVEWEVIVINNNSTDDTDAVLERHASHLPLIRLHEAKPGHTHARNRGLPHASGDLILWTDDDVQVPKHWLTAAVEGAARFPEAVGFAGPILPWFPEPPDPVLLEAFPALGNGFCGLNLGMEPRRMHEDEFAYGANMLFRASATQGLLFDTNIGHKGNRPGSGDDLEYQRRLKQRGGTFAWLPEMSVEHYVDPSRMTLDYLTKYYYATGEADARREGVPTGTQLFGMPRYLVRVAAERYLKFCVNRLRGRRRAALEHLRNFHYYRGVLSGCRQLTKAGRHA